MQLSEKFDIKSFLSKLDSEDIQSILFSDKLESVYQNEYIGKFNTSVKKSIFESQETLHVDIEGEFNYNGIFQSFTVDAYVSLSFDTLFQRYQEKTKIKNSHPKLSRTVLTRDGDNYSVQITETSNQVTTTKNDKIQIDRERVYFSTGSKLIMLRMLAEKNVTATFEIDFITKSGILGKCLYKPLSNGTIWANNEENLLLGYQESIDKDGEPSAVTQYMLAMDGHIIFMQNVSFDFTLKVVKFPGMLSLRQTKAKYSPVRELLNWSNDLEMRSKYLDYKERKKNDYEFYMANNPQLGRLLADLVQSVLLKKPHNIPQFLVDYFNLY